MARGPKAAAAALFASDRVNSRRFWQRRVAYPAYVDALVEQGYEGYMNWEFCHPALQEGAPAGSRTSHGRPGLRWSTWAAFARRRRPG